MNYFNYKTATIGTCSPSLVTLLPATKIPLTAETKLHVAIVWSDSIHNVAGVVFFIFIPFCHLHASLCALRRFRHDATKTGSFPLYILPIFTYELCFLHVYTQKTEW